MVAGEADSDTSRDEEYKAVEEEYMAATAAEALPVGAAQFVVVVDQIRTLDQVVYGVGIGRRGLPSPCRAVCGYDIPVSRIVGTLLVDLALQADEACPPRL